MRRTPLEAWIAQKVDGEAGGSGVLDRTALERYQLARLRDTVRLAAARSTFYRGTLATADDALTTLADVRRLPFTTPDDIRANPLAFVCVSQDAISRVVTLESSGTTGRPKRLYFTPADQELTVDFFRVGMSVFTGAGDRVLILLPGETPGSVGDLLATALLELGAIPIKHGPVREPEATMRIAAAERASVMVGVPTHVLRLARLGPAPLPLPDLHSVLLSTDHVPSALVAAVEAAWGCRVFNHFGMTEMGLGGGVDCEARRGYHLREADFLFEVVDPASGEPVEEGASGELVFTTLTRTGMPLIRYRTGDIARWLPGPCPCGTRLRTLAHVTTRVSGLVALGDAATITQAALDEAVFAVDGVVDFAAALTRGDGAGRLAVRIRVAPGADQGQAVDTVAEEVRRIPAIARATSRGVLAPVGVTATTESLGGPTLAKRSITLRPGQGSGNAQAGGVRLASARPDGVGHEQRVATWRS